MIAKNIFDQARSVSINELSPIYNHVRDTVSQNNEPGKYANNLSGEKRKYSNELRSFSTQKRPNSHEKPYASRLDSESELNEKYGIMTRNNIEQRNSLLLRSYDKYDHYSNKSKNHRVIEERQNDSQNSPVFQTNLNSSHKGYLFDHQSPEFAQTKPLPTPSLPSQYELLLQYELKREKQKNQILLKRINNKEQFIEEMKKIQEDLTIAYAKCQQELNSANTVIFQLQTKGTKQIRDYKEEIEELKHQIHVLQKQIIEKETQKPKKQSSKKSLNHLNSIDSSKEKSQKNNKYIKSKSSVNLTRFKSTTEVQMINPPIPKRPSNPMSYFFDFNGTKKSLIIDENSGKAKEKSLKNKNHESGMVRSHTQSVLSNTKKRQNSSEVNKIKVIEKNPVSHQPFSHQPLSSQFSSVSHPLKQESNLLNTFKPLQLAPAQISEFEGEIMSNLSKVANFLQHFIDMCEKMHESNKIDREQQFKENGKGKLIHELKRYWKWIKEVIKEWKEMKQEKVSQKKETKKFGGISNLKIKAVDEDFRYESEVKEKKSRLKSLVQNQSPQKQVRMQESEQKKQEYEIKNENQGFAEQEAIDNVQEQEEQLIEGSQ